MPELSTTDFVLGFDFGMRHIGVAVGQRSTQLARPLPAIKAENGVPKWGQVLALITEWEARALVVGIPYNMDGTKQNTTFAARRFANKLADRARLPAYLTDERLTSVEAKQQIHDQKLGFDVHSYSAKLILEQWLRSDEETWERSN